MYKLEMVLPDDLQEIKSIEIVNGFLVVMYEKKPKRPTTIEEVSSIASRDGISDAVRTLYQLIKIRDIWNGDWRPDWNDGNKKKHVLVLQENKYLIHLTFVNAELFYFKEHQTAQDFLNTFQADLNKIKILFQ